MTFSLNDGETERTREKTALSRWREHRREGEKERGVLQTERDKNERKKFQLLSVFLRRKRLRPECRDIRIEKRNAIASSLPRRKATRNHAKDSSTEVVEIKCPPERHVSTPLWELVEHAKGLSFGVFYLEFFVRWLDGGTQGRFVFLCLLRREQNRYSLLRRLQLRRALVTSCWLIENTALPGI